MTIKKIVKQLVTKLAWKTKCYIPHEQYLKAQKMIDSSKNMIDLGCGTNPHPKATAAVDLFLEPNQRNNGFGGKIDAEDFKKKSVEFINSNIDDLPFEDKKFDVSYSHHVIEHVNDPIKTCNEIQRISSRGIIICPSACAEYLFGRSYHKWFVSHKNNTLVFIEKNEEENQPFGEDQWHNPFDIALNEGNWYKRPIMIPFLRKRLRNYWYSHSPVIEIVFTWESNFNVIVINKDGKIKTSD